MVRRTLGGCVNTHLILEYLMVSVVSIQCVREKEHG